MPLRLLRTDEAEELKFDIVTDESLINNDVTNPLDGRKSFRYAILSHRWRDEEVTLLDCADLRKARAMAGWQKLDAFRTVARGNGYEHVWMDTCCIDKRSSTELSEALNSMFRWYEMAHICYAYLDDVHDTWGPRDIPPSSMIPRPTQEGEFPHRRPNSGCDDKDSLVTTRTVVDEDFNPARGLTVYRPLLPSDEKWANLVCSEWFTRGWTLQEMIAPTNLVFCNSTWTMIRECRAIAGLIAAASGVDEALLVGERTIEDYSIAQKLSWASCRKTTLPEDRAYSLFGILDTRIPIFYGEGVFAFHRLQEQLLMSTTDTTIFAWQDRGASSEVRKRASLLASSPDVFKNSGHITSVPTTAQQQRLQVIGSRVLRIDTFVYKPWDGFSGGLSGDTRQDTGAIQIVIGCVDNAPHTLITLSLRRNAVKDSAYTITMPGKQRLQKQDMFSAQDMDQTITLDVWRSSDDRQREHEPHDEQKLIFRSKHTSGCDIVLDLIWAWPKALWDDERGAFIWRESQNEEQFKGIVKLAVRSYWSCVEIKLIVTKGRGEPATVTIRSSTLRNNIPGYRMLVKASRFFPSKVPGSVAMHNAGPHYLKASVQERSMLQQQVQVVELELIDISQVATINFLKTTTILAHCCAYLIIMLSGVIVLALPVVLFVGMRILDYQGLDGSSLILLLLVLLIGTGTLLSGFLLTKVDKRVDVYHSYGRSWPILRAIRIISHCYLTPRRTWFLFLNSAAFALCIPYLMLIKPHGGNLNHEDLDAFDEAGLSVEQASLSLRTVCFARLIIGHANWVSDRVALVGLGLDHHIFLSDSFMEVGLPQI
ncbi:hypothetical protein AMS68_000273 [Peltaster fructicola]|uniref:Uncharacterized protein n=1 Tax=Peltaster fructicola TaxID=286661 RepID=A0A6H0XJ64_9PEZI|nr:hypothetical protein AMS68_000273 [Peltaster fructicola]